MISLCQRIAASRRFLNAILLVIVANAALIGLETSAALWERHGALFHSLNFVVQVVFAVEIAIRLLAHAPRFDRFFHDGWNVFDFTIVGLSLLPAAGPFATMARLARLLRALPISRAACSGSGRARFSPRTTRDACASPSSTYYGGVRWLRCVPSSRGCARCGALKRFSRRSPRMPACRGCFTSPT